MKIRECRHPIFAARKKEAFIFSAILLAATMPGMGCDATNPDAKQGNGPWIGEWIQVNFLAVDDEGIWDDDDLSGIGFVARITKDEWTETDAHGSGCSVRFSYSVDRDRDFVKKIESAGSTCPAGIPIGFTETGKLTFSDKNRFMIEYFDRQADDEIEAFKWMRE